MQASDAMLSQTSRIAFFTILEKEIARFLRIWVQALLPPAITMALYFVIFGNLIGSRIGEIHGFDYMKYIVPGLIMMGIMTNSYANVVSSFYSARFQRSVEEILVAPVSNALILIGFIAGGVARGIVVGLIITGISLFFTHLHVQHWGITLGIAILASILFSLAGFTNALFARNFDDISIIPTFVLTPLTYFGGVFYSVDLLPEFWQKVSLANPILYLVNAFRYGVLGVSDINIYTAFGITILFIVLLYLLNFSLLNRGVGIRN